MSKVEGGVNCPPPFKGSCNKFFFEASGVKTAVKTACQHKFEIVLSKGLQRRTKNCQFLDSKPLK